VSLANVDVAINLSRLTNIANRGGGAIIRTAFSSVITEARDFGCGVFDEKGELVACSSLGTPGLLGCLDHTLNNMLQAWPMDQLREGDLLITNDPWQASGHLNDISIATPVFLSEKLVGFVLSICHQPDIGGRGSTIEAKSVFEEGIRIPIFRLTEGGEDFALFMRMVTANLRVPDDFVGDIRGQLGANHLMAADVRSLVSELGVAALSEISDPILQRSEESLQQLLRSLPQGRYSAETICDGMIPGMDAVRVVADVTIENGEITVDLSRSSDQVACGINAILLGLTRSYIVYPIRCLDPEIPNNAGSLRPIKVSCRPGAIFNPAFPAPVVGRHMVAHIVPETVFAALAQVAPAHALANCGAAPAWMATLTGERLNGQPFSTNFFVSGGVGASSKSDGRSCMAFPSNVGNTPVEILEAEAPVLFVRREITEDSGGPGRFRGGFGQTNEMRVLTTELGDRSSSTMLGSMFGSRVQHPPAGIQGGHAAPAGRFERSGKTAILGVQMQLGSDDTLLVCASGGGGQGDPSERDQDLVRKDLTAGLISANAAREVYGVE